MQIRLLVARAAAIGSEDRGAIVDVSPDEAARMIEAGQAEAIRTAAPEKAVRRVKTEKAIK